jgi:hypothetical protein
MYSSTHFLTSALDGGEWSASRPGRFIPQVKSTWYSLDRRLGGPQSRSGHSGGEEKNSQSSHKIFRPKFYIHFSSPLRLILPVLIILIIFGEK